MAEDSGQEKTEKATPRKMKKVHEEGGLQKSQDLTAWICMAAAAATLTLVLSNAWDAARLQIATAMDIVGNPDVNLVGEILGQGLQTVLFTLAPLLAAVFIAAIAANVAQGGVHPSAKKLKPKFQNFNLIKGLKRVFGVQALWQGLKALLKTFAIGIVAFMVIKSLEYLLVMSGHLQLTQLLGILGGKINLLIWSAIAAGIVLAIFDVIFVIRKNRKQTRMSKQEIKEESKSTEGDPLIKQQIRSKQMSMSRNRMMSAVADADVIINNPTHLAVALRYEPGQGAPKVIAKGRDAVALKIREKAAEARVPLVENVSLARTLYATCEIGQSIPEELYEAVAKVLAFVMHLKRRGGVGGMHKVAT